MNKPKINKLINKLAFFIINLTTYFLIILLFFLISYILYNSLFFTRKEQSLFLNQDTYFVPLKGNKKNYEIEFIINKSVDTSSVSIKNIYDIYNNKISHWGSITDQGIDIIAVASNSSKELTESFLHTLVKNNYFNKNYIKVVKSNEELLDEVNKNEGAIGYILKEEIKLLNLKKYKNIKPIKVKMYSVIAGNETLKNNKNELITLFELKDIENLINHRKIWMDINQKDLKTIVFPYKDDKKKLINELNETNGAISIVPWHFFYNETNINFIRLESTEKTTPLNFNFIFSIPRDSGAFGGISYLILNTFYVITLTAFISILIGVGTGIMLSEYTQNKILYKIVSISVETLSAIPAIIFGLFGLMFFVPIFGMGILSGAITSSLMILPMIIKTTEEAFKSIPKSYKYASFALGANKTETVLSILLPSASSGILTGIVLAIGRALGETAVLLFTMGTNLALSEGLNEPARSLTVHLLILFQEGNLNKAFATASILIMIMLIINLTSKFLINKLYRIK